MSDGRSPVVVIPDDGYRLILADGAVVDLVVENKNTGGTIRPRNTGAGETVYSVNDSVSVSVSPVDDPEADDHPKVREALEQFGFDGHREPTVNDSGSGDGVAGGGPVKGSKVDNLARENAATLADRIEDLRGAVDDLVAEACDAQKDRVHLEQRIVDLENTLAEAGRNHETSDGRPPVSFPGRLDEIEKSADEARADTKDSSTSLTITSRVAELEEQAERLRAELEDDSPDENRPGILEGIDGDEDVSNAQ